MSDKPPADDDKGDEAEFERVLRNLVNTPHKPHNEKREPGKPNSRPVSDQEEPKDRE